MQIIIAVTSPAVKVSVDLFEALSMQFAHLPGTDAEGRIEISPGRIIRMIVVGFRGNVRGDSGMDDRAAEQFLNVRIFCNFLYIIRLVS